MIQITDCSCVRLGVPGVPCVRCTKLAHIGRLVDALSMLPFNYRAGQGVVPGPQHLDCLDAIAYILIALHRDALHQAMNSWPYDPRT